MTGQYWIIETLVLNIAKWLEINNLKYGKDAGPDNIRYNKVFWKFDDTILNWKQYTISTRNTGSSYNYRGISLSNFTSNIIYKIILNRIQPKVYKLLRNNQNGFRPDEPYHIY